MSWEDLCEIPQVLPRKIERSNIMPNIKSINAYLYTLEIKYGTYLLNIDGLKMKHVLMLLK